ncbi:hypothetical protein HAX54_050497 [Datura stramonium]|uniref:Uncharacterized protein n=1 Tax=Datura stramonium TaxID=4076 RepID=A0ABS8WLH0_DATST|nr:hypothetical protein [Datura stramonium]
MDERQIKIRLENHIRIDSTSLSANASSSRGNNGGDNNSRVNYSRYGGNTGSESGNGGGGGYRTNFSPQNGQPLHK